MKRSRGLFVDDDDEDDDEEEEVPNSQSQGGVAASQSSVRHNSNADIDDTVDDILALGDDATPSSAAAAAPAGTARRAQSPSGSLADFTDRPDRAVFDQGFPMFLRRDVDLVPASLRNDGIDKFNLPLDIVEDTQGVIRVPDEHVRTMDGVAKCLQLIPRDDLSFYTQPADGFPMTFLAR
jgi:hypothetical protein